MIYGIFFDTRKIVLKNYDSELKCDSLLTPRFGHTDLFTYNFFLFTALINLQTIYFVIHTSAGIIPVLRNSYYITFLFYTIVSILW